MVTDIAPKLAKIVILYFLLTLFLAVSLGLWPSHYKTEITALGERERNREEQFKNTLSSVELEKNKSVES